MEKLTEILESGYNSKSIIKITAKEGGHGILWTIQDWARQADLEIHVLKGDNFYFKNTQKVIKQIDFEIEGTVVDIIVLDCLENPLSNEELIAIKSATGVKFLVQFNYSRAKKAQGEIYEYDFVNTHKNKQLIDAMVETVRSHKYEAELPLNFDKRLIVDIFSITVNNQIDLEELLLDLDSARGGVVLKSAWTLFKEGFEKLRGAEIKMNSIIITPVRAIIEHYLRSFQKEALMAEFKELHEYWEGMGNDDFWNTYAEFLENKIVNKVTKNK